MRIKAMPKGNFVELSQEEIATLSDLVRLGYVFSWDTISNPTSISVAYVYEDEVIGMIEYSANDSDKFHFVHRLETNPHFRNMTVGASMLAYVAKDAFERGYDGFTLLESKTALRSYYVNRLGGIQIGTSNRIYFNEAASRRLIDLYLED